MMLKNILLSFLFIIPAIGKAQTNTTQYFDNKWLLGDKQHAAYYRVFTRSGSLYKVEDYTIDDHLLVSGYSDTLDIDISYNRQGKHIYYAKNGQKLREGNFINGIHDGLWIQYYRPSLNIEKKTWYVNGAIAHATKYTDTTGKITSDISYKEGKPDTVISYQYYPDGKLRSSTKKIGTKTEKEQCYSLTGADTSCETKKEGQTFKFVEQMPSPPYSMMEYLSDNVTYPERARLKGIQGRSLIAFVVMEDGTIEDVTVMQPVSPDIDEEAVRVIATMPKWRPGRQNGKPVKVMYTQPINFKLQ